LRGTCVLTGVAETVRHATVVDVRRRVTSHVVEREEAIFRYLRGGPGEELRAAMIREIYDQLTVRGTEAVQAEMHADTALALDDIDLIAASRPRRSPCSSMRGSTSGPTRRRSSARPHWNCRKGPVPSSGDMIAWKASHPDRLSTGYCDALLLSELYSATMSS
jgi:hypothetical protein